MAEGLAGAELAPGEPPAVLMGQGRVLEVGRAALGSGAPVRRLPGLWLTPAPMDAHVHLHLGGEVADNLAATASHGIAAVRDLGHSPQRSTPQSPDGRWPKVLASGPGLGTAGEGGSWLAEKLRGPEQMVEAVRRRAEAGAAVIKVFASGLLDFEHPGEVLHPLALTRAELQAAVEAAKGFGLNVAAHVSGADSVRAAVEAGVVTVEHGYFMDRPCLELMAERQVVWVPTLAAVLAHARDPQKRHRPEVRRNLMAIAQGQMRAMALAESLGVAMAVGTDAGSYGLRHGEALYTEIKAWLKAKISPYTVYSSVTKMFASMGAGVQNMGLIRKSSPACLLAVPGDPTQDPTLLEQTKWRSF